VAALVVPLLQGRKNGRRRYRRLTEDGVASGIVVIVAPCPQPLHPPLAAAPSVRNTDKAVFMTYVPNMLRFQLRLLESAAHARAAILDMTL
jgi:hypothetical protein